MLRQLEFIEDAVAQVSGTVHDQFERERKKSIVEVRKIHFYFNFKLNLTDFSGRKKIL